MPYTSYVPSNIFTRAMFDFDYFGISNYRLTGPIRVSVSDGFSNLDYYYGLVNSTDFTMNPLPNEINWSPQVKSNIQETLSVLSSFANLPFSNVIDYDTIGSGINSIVSPADVGMASDINITFINANSVYLSGASSGQTDRFGYYGSRGDVLINATGIAFASEGITFDDYTKSRQVLMHEIMHSLGLSHPFSVAFSGQVKPDYAALLSAGFDKLGFVLNDASKLDKEYFSIMSYDDESDISFINAYTPMIFDVIALQNAYGAGTGTTGIENDVFKAGTRGYRTYYDAGGVDTVDASLYSDGAHLNLGTSIVGANHLVGILMSAKDANLMNIGSDPADLRWLYGEYENAIGGVVTI